MTKSNISLGKSSTLSEASLNKLTRARAERNLSCSTIEPLIVSTDHQIDNQFFEKVNYEPDFLPARWLHEGAEACKGIHSVESILIIIAVCKINVNKTSFGSGFLVCPHVILTNHHVIRSTEEADKSYALFGYSQDSEGKVSVGRIVNLEPDNMFLTEPDLDFTFVGIDSKSETLLSHIQPLSLSRNPITVAVGENVNIIQHPNGRPQEVAFRANKVKKVAESVVWYETDTEPGSSGSPVFNDQWNLVALHHAGWSDDSESKRGTESTQKEGPESTPGSATNEGKI
jgi:V8-like Glu-specific endopeptidase